MDRIKIKDLLKISKPKDDVVIAGWIRSKRDSKKFSFIVINDGSTIKNVQVFVNHDLDNYDSELSKLTTGSSIKVIGDWIESEGKGQSFELKAKKIEVFGYASGKEYPLQKKGLSREFLRTIPHLRPRTNLFGCVFRIRSSLSFAVHEFFRKKEFVYVHTPIITGSDCEGAGEMFRVTTLNQEKVPKTKEGKVDYSKDFFGKEAFLTVSGQIEGELFATALSEIYTFGPTFRAENSHTVRHASEFWMIEPEMAFYDLKECMNLAEEFVKYVVKFILENNYDDLDFLNKWVENGLIDRLKNLLKEDFAKVSYNEAINILLDAQIKDQGMFDIKVEWGIDLGSEHEKYLTDKHFQKPIIVYNYPKDIKAFYMKANEDGQTVAAMDLLIPQIGELMGGSQREENLDKLRYRIKELGLKEEDYAHYLDTRKFGTVPHSGFGVGFERLIMFITGITNIRDVIPFPRTPNNAK